VVARDSKAIIEKFHSIEELQGKLKFSGVDEKLMHSVVENDKEKINEGRTITEAINQGIHAFTPDLLFDKFVQNYSFAEKLYGKRLLQYLSGYDPDYIEKNIRIPEFARELKKKIEEGIQKLRKDKLIDKDGNITDKGIDLASLILYMEELDHIIPKGGFGERVHKKASHYGAKEDSKAYKKGDRYRDISIKKSVKTAIRRRHDKLEVEDLRVYERESKGQIYIVYGMDASGSMKGKKIEVSKKAGIALAYKAIDNKDKVGLIVFGKEIKKELDPSLDFGSILREITKVRAAAETNIVGMIKKAVEMFPSKDVTKHLILLTDALPTIGKNPEEETLKAVSAAIANNISVSLVGIGLDDKGKKLAEKITELGEGRLYIVRDLEEIDKIVLEDYYSVR